MKIEIELNIEGINCTSIKKNVSKGFFFCWGGGGGGISSEVKATFIFIFAEYILLLASTQILLHDN